MTSQVTMGKTFRSAHRPEASSAMLPCSTWKELLFTNPWSFTHIFLYLLHHARSLFFFGFCKIFLCVSPLNTHLIFSSVHCTFCWIWLVHLYFNNSRLLTPCSCFSHLQLIITQLLSVHGEGASLKLELLSLLVRSFSCLPTHCVHKNDSFQ